MKLYVTYGSPYARLARIIVIEKALEDRVEIIEAKTRTAGSPYYQINPSGRVPYLVDDTGVGMEDSQLICAYLDALDGKPRFHNASHASDWAYLRFEFAARGRESLAAPLFFRYGFRPRRGGCGAVRLSDENSVPPLLLPSNGRVAGRPFGFALCLDLGLAGLPLGPIARQGVTK